MISLPNHLSIDFLFRLTESLMDRCLSLLSVGHSPILEITFEDCENRLTPLHIISIFDPKAQWFSLWMVSLLLVITQPFIEFQTENLVDSFKVSALLL